MAAHVAFQSAFAAAESRAFDFLLMERAMTGVASAAAPAAPKAAKEPKAEPKVEAVVAKAPEPAPAAPAPAAPAAPAKEEKDEDDIDLFGSDDEEVDEEAERIKQQRLKEYEAKKALKPAVIAKSQVILDVKPWDDETNMEELLANVLAIQMDGLLWGTHKLVPVGYGIKKLQITCVVEDDKVSIDELSDMIASDEDHVQSVDIAAFNKL